MGLKESGLRGSLRNTSSVLPAFFDVTITNTNSPVQEGDILTVDYSADNTGDAQDMQDIRLEIDSVQEDVDPDVMLAGGASTTGTLEWDTTGEPEAEYTATVLSDDDSDSVIVEIGTAIPDTSVSRDPDNTQGSDFSTAHGIKIETNVEWPEFDGEISSKTEGHVKAKIWRVVDGDDNVQIGEKDVSDLSAGDRFRVDLDENMVDGETYAIELGDPDGSFDPGFDDSPDFPYDSEDGDLSIVGGSNNGGGDNSNALCLKRVGNLI